MSSQGPKAPTFQAPKPHHPEKPEAIPPAPDTSPKAPPVTAKPKTPRDGTRPKENPGAVVYKTGGMIRVSKILSRAWKAEGPNPNAVPMDLDERRDPFFP